MGDLKRAGKKVGKASKKAGHIAWDFFVEIGEAKYQQDSAVAEHIVENPGKAASSFTSFLFGNPLPAMKFGWDAGAAAPAHDGVDEGGAST